MHLTDDFNTVVKGLRQAVPTVRVDELVATLPDPSVIEVIPEFKTYFWNRAEVRSFFNCYDYALNNMRRAVGRPGVASDDKPASHDDSFQTRINRFARYEATFSTFTKTIHEGLLSDGLVPMGHDFAFSAEGFPIALFLAKKSELKVPVFLDGGNDFHFYALRRKPNRETGDESLVWVSKPGTCKVEVCWSKDAITAPFREAQEHGYNYFGGFYRVPAEGLSILEPR